MKTSSFPLNLGLSSKVVLLVGHCWSLLPFFQILQQVIQIILLRLLPLPSFVLVCFKFISNHFCLGVVKKVKFEDPLTPLPTPWQHLAKSPKHMASILNDFIARLTSRILSHTLTHILFVGKLRRQQKCSESLWAIPFPDWRLPTACSVVVILFLHHSPIWWFGSELACRGEASNLFIMFTIHLTNGGTQIIFFTSGRVV